MKHKIHNIVSEALSYEILKIEVIPENEGEKEQVKRLSPEVESYLSERLDALSIIKEDPPFYFIKKTKPNSGYF
ncbi:hypothetical protein [Nafulsella turpanensis]|uniref:hypothetical protein n=1 Tax=Nafulsella turpanensis TaxID=1265690 RepID=UPI0003686449|nr:hypothetical protein [Nafulsella turpanensis]